MDQNSSFCKAQNAARSGWSGKFCNATDGLFWFTEGRFLKLAGLRYGFLVVNQTTAKTMPCQQTLKIGQMIPCKEEAIQAKPQKAASIGIWLYLQ